DHRSQRAVGFGVAVEVVQVDAQAHRSEEPARDAEGRARREPAPGVVLYVGRVVVDQRKHQHQHGQHDDPRENFHQDDFADDEEVADVGKVNELYDVVGTKQNGERNSNHDAEQKGNENRFAFGP